MIASFLALAPLLLPAPSETRWFLLEPESASTPLLSLTESEGQRIAREIGIEIRSHAREVAGRAIGYEGDDRSFLAFLLGLQPAESAGWLTCPEIQFRAVGFGTRIDGDQAFSRALAAPWKERSWLLALGGAVSLDEERLRRHLASPPTRKTLALRLQNLLRDAHAAENAREPRPPKLGYPTLGPDADLDIGDRESEALFSFRASGEFRRTVHRAKLLATGGSWTDDGIATGKGEGSLQFALDLGLLFTDDLLLVGRTAGNGKGRLLIDGLPLAEWKAVENAGSWGETLLRIPNRLLSGKEIASFEIRPLEGESLDLFHLQIRRLPFPEGEYISERYDSIKLGPHPDRSAADSPLVIGGYRFFKGTGVRAPSKISIELHGDETRFEALVGLDTASPKRATLVFRVLVDGVEKSRTRKIAPDEPPFPILAAFEKARSLSLEVEVTEGEAGGAFADWAEARVFR